MENQKTISFILRSGLAFSLLYPAFASLSNPDAWIGFLPIFIQKAMPAQLFLVFFSVLEIVLALWLLSGNKIIYASFFSGLIILLVVVFNFGVMDIVFRDVGLLALAVVLIVMQTKTSN